MRVQLLIATGDREYAEHLSGVLASSYGDVIDVSVCGTPESIAQQSLERKYDIGLLEASLMRDADLQAINLPVLLWSDEDLSTDYPEAVEKVRKYQRISIMIGKVLEIYSRGLKNARDLNSKRAHITAFWSPMGGVGKTTAALAYCAGKTNVGSDVLYLDIEQFSSISTYFNDAGRSVSAVFEMLESEEGNVSMLIRSIRQLDSGSGISYFSRPENFDDMNVLTSESLGELIEACSEMTDELVIDMSSVCDDRTQKVFQCADRVYCVVDNTPISQTKFMQFTTQHNVFAQIKDKTSIVANKGALVSKSFADTIVSLPFVQSADAVAVYKALSVIDFEIEQVSIYDRANT